MRFIIAGAGAVGTHLSKLLAGERHDITLIDESQAKLDGVGGNIDIMTYCASPLSIRALREADVAKADVFIAVMPDEARNMTCCMLAARISTKADGRRTLRTVARVDNEEYTAEEHQHFFSSAGIDSLIYPEMLAGKEIVHNILRTWVRNWWDFGGGALVLLSVKVRAGAPILDHPLMEICRPESPFHIVAMKRGGDTLIPHGHDIVQDGDIVFVMTKPKYVEHIREIAGKEQYPDVDNVFIMGGTNTALHIAKNAPHYMRCKIFETDYARSERLQDLLADTNVMVIHGDGRDPDLLREENVDRAQAFVATTDNAETNILACLAAKRMGIRKTVAMVENTDYIPMAESLDIGSIINKKTFVAGHIYQMMLRADVTSMKSLTIAKADVAEIRVPEGARITRRPVKDLGLPATVNLGGLIRDGKGVLINGGTQIQAGDTVVAFCLENEIKRIEKFFK